MPAVIAGHFNAAGVANSWQPKQVFFGLFALVYVLITVTYLSMPRLLNSLPVALISLPNKDYWLAPQRRVETTLRIGDQMAWFGAAVMTMLVIVGQLAIQANLPGSGGRLTAAVWLPFGALAIFSIVWGIRFFSIFRVPSQPT